MKKALQNNIPSIDTMDIIPGVDAADINHFFHEVKILEGGVDVTASFLDLF